MKFKIRVNIFLFGLIAFIPSSLYAASWTLADCLKQAEKENLSLKVSKLNENRAGVILKTAKTDYYPTVSANINNTLYDSPLQSGPQDHYRLSLGINGSMTLWNGGATSLSVETATLDKEEAVRRTELSLLNVRESILNAFFSYLSAKEKIGIATASLELSKAEYENNNKLFEVGSLTQRDLVLSEADAAQKQVALLTAEQNLENAQTALRQLLELDRQESFEISTAGLDTTAPDTSVTLPPFEEVFADVQKKYPGLAADSLAALSAQKNVKLAGKNSSISVTLGAQASTGLQAWESDAYGKQLKHGYNHSITLAINIPIIDRGVTTNKILSAQIESAQAEISKQETSKNLENIVEQLYLNALSAERQWIAATIQQNAYESALKFAENQKAAGAITYTDYLEHKNNLETAKLTVTQAKYTTLLARALLNLYRGNL